MTFTGATLARQVMLLLGCLLAWPAAGSATVVQVPTPRLLGMADGLDDPQVRAIAEDASGYLWLAGSDGLMRFDGQRYRLWRREEGLPDVDLRALHVDARDRLWLGTASEGLVMMGADRSGFQRLPASAPAALRNGHLRQVSSTGDGRLWAIGSDQALYGLSPRDPEWQRHRLQGAAVTALVLDRHGALWVAQAAALWRWDGARFARVPLPSPAAVPIQSLWADPKGGIEVSTATGTWAMGAISHGRAPAMEGRSVLRSADGTLWQQGGAGLQRREGGRVLPVPLLPAPGGALGIGSHYALALAASGQHHAWVAGSRGRLQRVDLRTGHGHDVGGYPHAGVTALPVGLAEDARGRVWVASADRLLRYDPAQRRRREWPLGLHAPEAALSLQVCTGDQIWLSHPQAVQQWTSAGEKLRDVAPEDIGLVADLPARQLLCTRDGELWAADPSGAMRWSPARERFERMAGDGDGGVSAIAEGDDGTLWISRTAALEQYRRVQGGLQRLRRVGQAEGYPRLRAEALVVGTDGAVWAGAARGLVRVDPRSGEVTVLGTAQGLPAQEVLSQRLLQLGSGAVVAGMREGGLLAFDPRALRAPRSAPVLVLDAMSRRRHGRMIQVPVSLQPVILGTADRNVRVAVRLLGRGDPDRIQYRFRLLGQDPGWIDTGPVAQRLFARLPAGEHTLLVQARHAGGPWSSVRQLSLRVVPRWWETGAGQAAASAAVCLAAVVFTRLHQRRRRRRVRRRHARARHQRAEQDSLQRSRFLAELGSQVRMPLTPVLGWSELLLQSPLSSVQREQVGSLQQAGQHLLQLMDDALDLAGIESGRLQLQAAPFSLAGLMRELHALLLPVAQRKALALHWTSTLEPEARLHGDVQRLRQILLNLLGNALKFTAHGQVSLTAQVAPGARGLLLCVADTGPGMTPAQVQRLFQRFSQANAAATLARHGGSGLGLAISRELAQALGGTLEVESQRGRGTRFQLTLPWHALPAAAGADSAAAQAPLPATPLRVMVMLSPGGTNALDVVCALLRAQGHRVVGVHDVDAWVRDVDPGPWDMIAADPDMLVAGGRLSARLPWLWPGVRRMALTARADACAERDARAGGFELFLRLPLTGSRLAAAVGAA